MKEKIKKKAKSKDSGGEVAQDGIKKPDNNSTDEADEKGEYLTLTSHQ